MTDSFPSSRKPLLIILTGPTAGGKTALAIDWAQWLNTVILSADSRQIYREMSIGTAKPSPEELNLVPHFFISSHSIHERFTAGQFAREARQTLDSLFRTNHFLIMVGGTGLYIQALLNGLDEFPHVENHHREFWHIQYQQQGIESLQKSLLDLDPTYYQNVDIHNPQRLMRALEVCSASGKPYSFFLNPNRPKPELPFDYVNIALEWDRAVLYERINQRVINMIQQGLEAEARALYPWRNLPALQTVGYREWWDYFEGKQNYSETIAQIQQNTRNFAKRQITWLRKVPNLHSLPGKDPELVTQWLKQHISKKQ